MTISLYPDQQSLIDQTRALMRRRKSVLVQAATGFGKTVLTAAMVQGAAAKGSRAMMVLPRRELLRQTSRTFDAFGIQHTFISAGYPFNPFDKTILATAGTLARRLDKSPVPQVVFIDETHYGGVELDRIIRHYQASGAWVIGLSATPVRLDGKGLGMWYQDMASGPPVADLIDAGRLSSYRMFAPGALDLGGIKTTAGDYAKGQLSDRMEQDRVLTGNAVAHYRQHADGLLNVAFCVSVKHAEMVAEAFRAQGVPSAPITGAMDDDERARLIRAFARRELHVLTSVDLLCFGFDLASAAQMDVTIECMSDLRPTQSVALQYQKWGRALRKKDTPAMIFDHAGNAMRHGLPDDPQEWSLEGLVKRKGGGDRAEPVRQCSSCYFCHRPAPLCPSCGFEYPVQSRDIEEVEGDLQEVARVDRRAARIEQGRAQTLDDLRAIAARTGKNPRWADHVWNARQAKRHAAG